MRAHRFAAAISATSLAFATAAYAEERKSEEIAKQQDGQQLPTHSRVTESKPRVISENSPKVVSESRPKVMGASRPKVVTESTPKIVSESRPKIVGESRPKIVTPIEPQKGVDSKSKSNKDS